MYLAQAVSDYRRGFTDIPRAIPLLLEQTNKHDNMKITKTTPQEFKEKQAALGWNNKQMAD